MQRAHALADRDVGFRRTLVLAEVLGPGVDEEDLDPRPWILRVLVEGPADRPVAATQTLDVAHDLRERVAIRGIDAVPDRDHDGAAVERRLDDRRRRELGR